jgi:peptidylprolyl isomerase
MKNVRIFLTAFVFTATWSANVLAAKEMLWRKVEAENTVYMELQEGRVIIELNPLFAADTVAHFQRLVQSRFYDGLSFYRVIDGFVAQGGDGSDLGEISRVPLIDREFEIDWSEDIPFVSAQKPDLFAPETGFIDGFAVARDVEEGKTWLTHCPGVVAMARNDDPDSSRTDFYIVIGQAPRYLDRNLTVFGRVVDGMDIVQRIRRGPPGNGGVFTNETASTRIRSMKLLSEYAEKEQPTAYIMDTNSKAFDDLMDDRRKRKQKFFHHKPPQVLDVCQVPVGTRLTK